MSEREKLMREDIKEIHEAFLSLAEALIETNKLKIEYLSAKEAKRRGSARRDEGATK